MRGLLLDCTCTQLPLTDGGSILVVVHVDVDVLVAELRSLQKRKQSEAKTSNNVWR